MLMLLEDFIVHTKFVLRVDINDLSLSVCCLCPFDTALNTLIEKWRKIFHLATKFQSIYCIFYTY